MPTPESVLALIRDWIRKADNDLKNAVHTLTLGQECPTDTVCFHAQQCTEKYIKALLVFRATPFAKTHDIRKLLALIPARIRPKIESRTKDRLTEYATVMRYPGGGPEISLTEARKAVALARGARRDIRRLLPRAALWKKRG
jgi:HEPN domain-containing protein